MFLVIDNYDSFVHNLARYFMREGKGVSVVRNDEITLSEIERQRPEALILSPGPCTPSEAGICIEAIRTFGASIPILGVCLGHQCVVEAYGGETVRAAQPIHGRTSEISHEGQGVFKGIENPACVGRYHSLVTMLGTDSPLRITARTKEGEIMAVAHESLAVYGVQFHPESILTAQGIDIIRNFVTLTAQWRDRPRSAA